MYFFFLVLSALALKLAHSEIVCEIHQLPCDDGRQCVDRGQWCDKEDNCDDKSDEAYCRKASFWSRYPNDCKQTHFLCGDGPCVPKIARCDGYEDCKDVSDEEDCEDSKEKKTVSVEATTSDESSSISESGGDSESSGEIEENGSSANEKSIFDRNHIDSRIPSSTPNPIERFSVSQEPPPSSTTYYQKRMKEMQSPSTQEITSPTQQTPATARPSISTASIRNPYKPLSTTVIPPSRTYYNHSRSTSYYPTVQPYFVTSSKHPSGYINRPPAYNTNPPVYVRRPSKYDHRLSANNRLSYDNRPSAYGRHPPVYGRHSSGHDIRPSTFGRTSYPSIEQSNVLNGDANGRQDENLRPYRRETDVIRPFYFAKDYTRLYGQRNARNLQEAKKWLLDLRDSSGSWGRDTPRALVALALTDGNFSKGIPEYELMKRNFLVQLGMNVLRKDSKEFNLNRLAMAMNALLAVCENPRDFHGIDLTELLNVKILEHFKSRKRPFVNPFVYLSQCLSGKTLGSSELQTLMKQMHISPSAGEISKDVQSIAIQAFSCYIQQSPYDLTYRRSLQAMLQSAVAELLQRMLSDGSFGSVYSTSLAAQALISANDSGSWESEKTMNFLKQQQKDDGSFGDLLATYYTIPALSGRSLLHLRNIHCEPTPVVRDLTPTEILEFPGPRQYIHYSIYFNHPLSNSYSMRVLVPEGINLLDMMRVAEHQDTNFRFAFEEDDQNFHVYSASGLPNDPEQGLSWHLYVRPDHLQYNDPNFRELFSGDVRKYLPKFDDHVILWYHPTDLSSQ